MKKHGVHQPISHYRNICSLPCQNHNNIVNKVLFSHDASARREVQRWTQGMLVSSLLFTKNVLLVSIPPVPDTIDSHYRY